MPHSPVHSCQDPCPRPHAHPAGTCQPEGPASLRDPSFYSWQSLGLTGGSKRGRSCRGIENSTCQSCSPSPLPLPCPGPCGEEVTEKRQQNCKPGDKPLSAPPSTEPPGSAPTPAAAHFLVPESTGDLKSGTQALALSPFNRVTLTKSLPSRPQRPEEGRASSVKTEPCCLKTPGVGEGAEGKPEHLAHGERESLGGRQPPESSERRPSGARG